MNPKAGLKNSPCFYEMALYLAIAKAKQDEFGWERFIDDLSEICDKFAYQIASKRDSTTQRSRV